MYMHAHTKNPSTKLNVKTVMAPDNVRMPYVRGNNGKFTNISGILNRVESAKSQTSSDDIKLKMGTQDLVNI